MTTILITRPQPDADALAGMLRERGVTPLVDSLFAVKYAETAPQNKNYQAAIATSRNAIRALVACSAAETYKNLPLFAVGTETENEARTAGFIETHCADQSAVSLAPLILAQCHSDAGPLLYLAGVVRKPDIEEALAAQNFTVDIWEGYDMQPSAALKSETVAALLAEQIDTVLLFSERAATHFMKLTRHLPRQALSAPAYFCLSEQVAAPLLQKGYDVHVADKAVLHALVDTLEQKNH